MAAIDFLIFYDLVPLKEDSSGVEKSSTCGFRNHHVLVLCEPAIAGYIPAGYRYLLLHEINR